MNRDFVAPIFCVLLAATVCAGAEPPEEWVERRDVYNLTGNLTFGTRWDPDAGACFKIARGGTDKAVQVTLHRKGCKVSVTPDSSFSTETADNAQFKVESLPDHPLERAEIVVKFRRRIWTVYVENRPVAVFPVPFVPPLLLSQPASQVPLKSLQEVRFQRTADFRFEDGFMAPEGTPNQLAAWETESGTWGLMSAADNGVSAPGNPKDGPKPEFSPNFYCAIGSGTGAIMTAGHDFYDSYSMSASTRVVPGEMGIVFFFRKDKGYHAFTVDMKDHSDNATLKLWRVRPDGKNRHETLAAVSVQLTGEQWVRLEAKTFLNRIQCFLDGVEVIDIASELPAGGRFGLYADGKERVRFDDVSAEFNRDLDCAAVSRLRRYCLYEQGEIFPRRRRQQLLETDRHDDYLDVDNSRDDQWAALGEPEHQGQVFSADFRPDGARWKIGLLAGFTAPDQPYLRFTCERTTTNELFRLEAVGTNTTGVLEELSLPTGEEHGNDTVVGLMCDASVEGELRLYRNRELVLIHHPRFTPVGASGLFVGAGTAAKISNTTYRFERHDLYKNEYEKNRAFVDDPFMRHWSSPEGQWITMPDNSTWHKSDFFGRFLLRMPQIPGSEIHLGVGEGATNGEFVIKATAGALTLVADGAEEEQSAELSADSWYTVNYEDHWLWIASEGKPLLRRALTQPLRGTRIRIAGFSVEQLKHSYVERYNVKDHLFTKSLHEWVVNGGKWAVVNRFQCQPRWSHMTGETTNGLAALWSKYDFSGDFCAEMYAGMRHGWYERAGDLNLTIMSDATTPGRGYTVTCTGWDPDHSQLFTRFFRNGKIMAVSDKFLIPRNRGSFAWNATDVRKGWNPLVQKGRPLHGAWFYIKLRRIGKRLEYHFDNELVFSIEDDDPIPAGRFGIWTFMNSMVVARVKVAAREIRPEPFTFTPVKIDDDGNPVLPTKPEPPDYDDVTCNSEPLESCARGRWESDDPTGRSRLNRYNEKKLGPYFVSTSILGGGEAFTRSAQPPVARKLVAGWRFYARQTPNARFNFHYSTGRMKDAEYQPEQRFFHRISGTDFSKGPFTMTGATTVPPADTEGPDWHADGEWTLVEVWIPPNLAPVRDSSDLLVRVEGFGNLQPSDIKQGLDGNCPGAAYAIRDFSEIRYTPPNLALSGNGPAPDSFTVLDERRAKRMAKLKSIGELAGWVTNATQPGMVLMPLRIDRADGEAINEVAWINLPEMPELSCSWHEDMPYTVRIGTAGRYPDPRLTGARLRVAGAEVALTHEPTGVLLGKLPRTDSLASGHANTLPMELAVAGRTYPLSLDWTRHTARGRPVLLAAEGLTPLLANFENRVLSSPLQVDPARMSLEDFDPVQDCYLAVCNRGKEERLNWGISAGIRLARYPLFQFRCRGFPMSAVTMTLDGSTHIRLTENFQPAATLRCSEPPALDGRWHTWYGMLSDTVTSGVFDRNVLRLNRIAMGSLGRIDQTGLYSEWDVDDIVFGPAVASADHLSFTPRFFEFGGVASVHTAVRPGPTPFAELSDEQAADLRWQTTTNETRVVPDIAGLTNGICRLFVKATGRNGVESSVTDVPFLMAAGEVKASHSFDASSKPEHNASVLSVAVDTAGAPMDAEDLELRWNGKKVDVPSYGSSIVRGNNREQLILNWPYIFRKQLRDSSDGGLADITVANIRNGAGTVCPDLVVPLTINYTDDTTPPTLLPTQFPTNIMWFTGWESPSRSSIEFNNLNSVNANLVRNPGEEPYLQVNPTAPKSFISRTFNPHWPLKKYPYLAFRLRIPGGADKRDSGPRLTLRLTSGGGQSYLVPLTHTSYSHPRYVGTDIPANLDRQTGVWHSITMDLREVLQTQLPDSDIERLEIKDLALVQDDTAFPFHLQSFYVYSAGSAEDRVTLDAFDASGIGGVSVEYTGRTSDMGVSPASLGSRATGKGWLLLRAVDRAGNPATPVRVPVWPVTETVKGGAP